MKPFAIDNPCSETWNAMRIEHGGSARHCASCEKHVVDLRRLTEAQIRGLVALKPGGFCGRQTIVGGELVVAPEPVAMRSRWPLRLGLGGALMAGTLATAACEPAAAAGPEPTPILVAGEPTPAPVPAPAPEPTPAPEPEPREFMGEIAPAPPTAAHVTFERGSSKISRRDLATLREIASALNANTWIQTVGIEAYAAMDEGGPARLAKLVAARAEAVRTVLIKNGVDPKRLRVSLEAWQAAALEGARPSADVHAN